MNSQNIEMSAKYRNEYLYAHKWVYKNFGKASCCELDATHSSKVFEWSNKSKHYIRDRKDWIQLCQSCHRKMDYTENTRRALKERNMGNKYNVKKVMQKDIMGNFIKEWESGREAARVLDILPTSICNAVMGRAKTAGGYIWH